jgi:TolB protein
MVRRIALALVLVVAAGCSATAAAPAPKATSPSPSTNPVPSPVASAKGWLAYQSVSPRGGDGVFLVRTDGSGDHEIVTDIPGQRRHPDFSRDGKHLVFDQTTSDADVDQVYVANADGSGARQVSKCQAPKCAGLWEPAWSPDGRQLAIASSAGFHPGAPSDRFGIAIINLAKRTVRSVVDHDFPTGQDHFPRWSPDGRQLVFWRDREGKGDMAVFVVNVDGSGLRQLTDWDMRAGDADWSPDGKRIVFGTQPLGNFQGAGHSELYTIRPDGKGLRRLTHYGSDGPRATQPRWTPDSKAILYTRTTQEGRPRHIYVLSANGKHDAPVLTAKPIYTHPILQPTP